MNRKTPFALIPAAVLALLLQGATVHAQRAAETREVTITLHSEATVDDTMVTLDQIAKITGGSEALRKRLGKLDVIDFPTSAGTRVVTSDLVRFRLLLGGMEANEFRLNGAKRTTIIEPDEPVSFRRLFAVAEHAVRLRYPGDTAGLAVTAGKGIVIPLIEAHPADRIRFEAAVKGAVPSSGRIGVDVALVVNGKKREVVPVFLDIVAPAVVAKTINGNREQPVRPAANWTPNFGTTPPTIKARDNVKLVVTIGDAHIEASGEAQEDGRVGQIIRVRNVESSRIVHGRVEASGIIIVEP